MARKDTVRIVNTNDFFGSYAPMKTSYGWLPGGEGLKQTVERLREGQPTIWADDGDFAEGGPLAPATDGMGGFEAAADLGIDVGVVGNHEFDWSLEHLQEHASKVGYSLLCANADAGLPATHVTPTETGDVGFIGLTNPMANVYAPGAPEPNPDLERIVTEASERLRKDGVDFVVVLFHDGVDVLHDNRGRPAMGVERFIDSCRPWVHSVDAVVAGHTLGNFFGHLEGVPVCLPWAFGSEVGVIELTRGEQPSQTYGVPTDPGGPWTGAGAGLIERAESEVLGYLDDPLYRVPFARSSLLDYMALALRESTDADAAAVAGVEGGFHQPPLDGVLSFLPEGEVTEADLLRVVYWLDDSTVRVELTPAELAAFQKAELDYSPQGWGVDLSGADTTQRSLMVAMSSWSASKLEGWLGREMELEETSIGLHDTVRTAVKSNEDASKEYAGSKPGPAGNRRRIQTAGGKETRT